MASTIARLSTLSQLTTVFRNANQVETFLFDKPFKNPPYKNIAALYTDLFIMLGLCQYCGVPFLLLKIQLFYKKSERIEVY